MWPDPARTPTQLKEEIQWLIYEGYEYLENDLKEEEDVIDKLFKYAHIAAPSEEANEEE